MKYTGTSLDFSLWENVSCQTSIHWYSSFSLKKKKLLLLLVCGCICIYKRKTPAHIVWNLLWSYSVSVLHSCYVLQEICLILEWWNLECRDITVKSTDVIVILSFLSSFAWLYFLHLVIVLLTYSLENLNYLFVWKSSQKKMCFVMCFFFNFESCCEYHKFWVLNILHWISFLNLDLTVWIRSRKKHAPYYNGQVVIKEHLLIWFLWTANKFENAIGTWERFWLIRETIVGQYEL